MSESIDALKRLGAVVIDPPTSPRTASSTIPSLSLALRVQGHLNKYLAARGPEQKCATLKELIASTSAPRARDALFGQELFIRAEEKGPLTSRAYLAALRKNQLLTRSQGIDAVMRRHRLDALVAPTGGPPWPTDLVSGDHFTGGYSSASAVAGYPHVTVPAGYVFGLPVGLSFFGGAWSEPKLITFAYAFEQATRARRPPKFTPAAVLG